MANNFSRTDGVATFSDTEFGKSLFFQQVAVVGRLLFTLNMSWGHDTHIPAVRLSDAAVSTDFLDRLASQLKIGRDSAYRRKVQRMLETVRKTYESGEYRSTTEAEHVFRKLVEQGDK